MSEGQKKLMAGLLATILESRDSAMTGVLAIAMSDDDLWLTQSVLADALWDGETVKPLTVRERAKALADYRLLCGEILKRGPGFYERALRLAVPKMETPWLEKAVVNARKVVAIESGLTCNGKPLVGRDTRVTVQEAAFQQMYLDICGAELARRAAQP